MKEFIIGETDLRVDGCAGSVTTKTVKQPDGSTKEVRVTPVIIWDGNADQPRVETRFRVARTKYMKLMGLW